jgi:hypothetical protein
MSTENKSTNYSHADWKGRVIGAGSCVLIFLSMAYPTVSSLVEVKGALFGTLLVVILLEFFLNGRSRLASGVVLWTLCLATVSTFFVLEGLLARAPGAGAVITVYILWPLTFTLWIAGLAQSHFLVVLDRTAVIATLFIGVYGCLYLLTSLGILPDNGFVASLSLGWENEAFGPKEGYTEMAFAGMNSLAFLLPYVVASIAIRIPSERKQRVWNAVMWLACISGCAIVLTAGRRALMLLTVLSPGLVVFFRSFQPEAEKRLNRRSIVRLSAVLLTGSVILLIVVGMIYEFSASSLLNRFISGFDIGAQATGESELARYEQLGALWRGWLQHPILGSGHGSGTLASIRSDTMPWAYELSYLALLFQTGIAGFAAYLAGVLWMLSQGIKIIREGGPLGRIMLPMLVGFSGLLIANATNPYLLRFDGMWMFFLPLAVINYRLATPAQKLLSSYRSQSALSFNQ